MLLLDARNRMISMSRIYRGSLSSASMRVNELFREAIRNNAASIVVAHNHPSQDHSPSSDDVFTTKEIVKAERFAVAGSHQLAVEARRNSISSIGLH